MSRRFVASLCIVVGAVAALSACENPRRALGLEKNPPDEFMVVTRAPLTLPPDYSLRPPQPGAVRPQEGTAADLGRSVLTGATASSAFQSAGLSQGEAALLQQANTGQVPEDIRTMVDRETSVLAAESRTFTDRLVFWRDEEEPATLVDATEEARRIRENQALGRPVTTGETPQIERRRKALLEGLF